MFLMSYTLRFSLFLKSVIKTDVLPPKKCSHTIHFHSLENAFLDFHLHKSSSKLDTFHSSSDYILSYPPFFQRDIWFQIFQYFSIFMKAKITTSGLNKYRTYFRGFSNKSLGRLFRILSMSRGLISCLLIPKNIKMK